MELYLIEYNGVVIGAYDDFNMAELFIKSCIQSKLMTSASKIIKYTKNSCFSTGSQLYNTNNIHPDAHLDARPSVRLVLPSEFVNQPKIRVPDNIIIPPIDLEKNETYQKVAKEKSELLHNINLIKAKKEKMIESKQVYENDLKLFELFSMNKKSDSGFIIPELFLDKFTLLNNLRESGTLSWETFMKEHKTNQSNEYDDYFAPNNYENEVKAYDSSANCGTSINEELDIETDSDTDCSEK
jgi:hypothetical protein